MVQQLRDSIAATKAVYDRRSELTIRAGLSDPYITFGVGVASRMADYTQFGRLSSAVEARPLAASARSRSPVGGVLGGPAWEHDRRGG
jgi:hypothetical protein